MQPARRKAEDLPENKVEKEVLRFLRRRGWILVRQHSGLFRRYAKGPRGELKLIGAFSLGEKSKADWLCYRPIFPGGKRLDASKLSVPHLVFFWEAKGPGEKPSDAQLLWMEKRTATGTPAFWADSMSMFLKRYQSFKFEAWF